MYTHLKAGQRNIVLFKQNHDYNHDIFKQTLQRKYDYNRMSVNINVLAELRCGRRNCNIRADTS